MRGVDYDEQFYGAVEFDDESWIDKDGLAQPVHSKHTFYLPETILRKEGAK